MKLRSMGLWLALFASAGVNAAEEEGLFAFGADAMLQFDDNQSRAERRRDQIEDMSLLVSGNVTTDWEPSITQLFAVTASVELERFDDISALDRNSLQLKGAWRWQPDPSFLGPIFEINASTRFDDVKTDQRSSTVNRVQTFVTRRLTDKLTTSFGLEYRTRDSEGSVWDLIDKRWFLNLDLLLTRRDAAYFTFSRISGDTFSSAQRTFCNGAIAWDLLDLVNAGTELEPDEAYNDELCGDWVAYRLDANTNVFNLGYNRGFGHTMALDFSWTFVDVTGRKGNEYDRNLIRATLLKRF